MGQSISKMESQITERMQIHGEIELYMNGSSE